MAVTPPTATSPTVDPDAIGARALSVLAKDGPALPSPDLAARVATAALASPPPATLLSTADDALAFFDGLFALARPAAGLACALALVLGVAAAARASSRDAATAAGSASSLTAADVAQLGIADPDASLFTWSTSTGEGDG